MGLIIKLLIIDKSFICLSIANIRLSFPHPCAFALGIFVPFLLLLILELLQPLQLVVNASSHLPY